MLPLISVIIPIYKVEKYLDRCIESVVNQTYRNLEIILVDDGSPDNCPMMCDDWATKDSRIKVFHKKNGGLAAARNSGLKLVTGDYIAFLDSDDYLDLETYEKMLLELLENNADIISWGMVRESENGYTEPWGNGEFKILNQLEVQQMLGYANGLLPVHSSNKIFSKKVIGDVLFDESLRFAEDIMFNFDVSKNVNKLVIHNINYYHYTNNTSSISYKSFDYPRFDEHKVMDAIVAYAKDNDQLLPYCVIGDTLKSFRTIKQMCISNQCMDMYPDMRKRILGYKHIIFKSRLSSIPLKMKTLFIMLLPNLYKVFIKNYGKKADKKYAALAGIE